jgi:DHA1 family inner membrane transport protein
MVGALLAVAGVLLFTLTVFLQRRSAHNTP